MAAHVVALMGDRDADAVIRKSVVAIRLRQWVAPARQSAPAGRRTEHLPRRFWWSVIWPLASGIWHLASGIWYLAPIPEPAVERSLSPGGGSSGSLRPRPYTPAVTRFSVAICGAGAMAEVRAAAPWSREPGAVRRP